MQAGSAIDEMSGSQLLDHVEALAGTQRRCEVEILRVAVQHAVLNHSETLDPELTRLPGRERARRFGGVGTPEVAEFAAAELGARLGISSWSANALMADALDILIRLPRLWARVEALEVKASYARFVARRTRDLEIEQAAHVDARVAESADGRVPWSRFEDLVEAAVKAADPVAAATRERNAAGRQFAEPTRSTEDGMRGFYIRCAFPIIARLDATVEYLADALAALGDTDDRDARRVKAVLILANPDQAVQLLTAYQEWRTRRSDPPEIDWTRLLPVVQLFVHMYCGDPADPGDVSDGIARVERVGAVTETWLRDMIGPFARFNVRPVLDLAGQAPVDGYEIPDRHRQAVHLMTPADTFPFSSSTSRSHQIDHTVPYQHGESRPSGQSRLGNYGPMTTPHHRLKTFGCWKVQQPFPGIYLWRDRYDATYLVDHTGTRRVDPPASRPPVPSPSVTVEIHRTDHVLEWAA
jgi:Domain of unknown function (DUF222)